MYIMCMCLNTYLCTAAHMHDMLVLTSDSESATLKTYKTIPISVCFHTYKIYTKCRLPYHSQPLFPNTVNKKCTSLREKSKTTFQRIFKNLTCLAPVLYTGKKNRYGRHQYEQIKSQKYELLFYGAF